MDNYTPSDFKDKPASDIKTLMLRYCNDHRVKYVAQKRLSSIEKYTGRPPHQDCIDEVYLDIIWSLFVEGKNIW